MLELFKLFKSNELHYALEQNSPNPFTSTTVVRFSIAKSGPVSLKLFDSSGHEVMTLVDENRLAGKYAVALDGARMIPGVYYYRLTAGGYSAVKQLELRKQGLRARTQEFA